MEIFLIEVDLLTILNYNDGREMDIYPFLKSKLRRNYSKDNGLKIQSLLVVLERRGLIKVNTAESNLLLLQHDSGSYKEVISGSIMAGITDGGRTHIENFLSNNFSYKGVPQKEVPHTKQRQHQSSR